MSRRPTTRRCLAAALFTSLASLPALADGAETDKLTANDAAADDNFGFSVGISGNTAVVGAAFDDDHGGSSGSVYLFDTATGNQGFKLTANDAAADDLFGWSVGISGSTAIVGAAFDDGEGGIDSGSAYLFDTITGNQRFKLTASDGAAEDLFGWSVGISGSTAIVGASGDENSSGSAYLFDTTTGNQRFKLTANDAEAGAFFGYSVGISGSTAIVGAHSDDDGGSFSGSAYLFDTTTGNQLFKLTASDGAAGDLFGWSVGISGSTAIVGAITDDDGATNSGSAYLFDTTTGNQLFKLTANDGAADDRFGWSVGISGNTAIVGATRGDANGITDAGSAYLFDTTTGKQIAKLAASDAATSDHFGVSVGISGSSAITGARSDDDGANASGSAYLYSIDRSVDQTGKLIASDGASADLFGYTVAIDGDNALVGAFSDDDAGSNSGSVYVFDPVTGQEKIKLTASDASSGDLFGRAVDLDGTTALIGARLDGDKGTNSGSAYLFDITTGNQLAKLTAPDGAANDEFGTAVAIEGSTAIVGANLDDDNGADSGSVYVFDASNGNLNHKLTAPDGEHSDQFGADVDLSNGVALIGSPFDRDHGVFSGSAYLFDTASGNVLRKLTADDAADSDFFGTSVGIDGTTAIVGATGDDDNGSASGSAYLFDTVTGNQLFKLTANDGSAGDDFGIDVDINGTTALVGARFQDTNGDNAGATYLFDTTTGLQLAKLIAGDGAAGDEFGRSVALSGGRIIVGAYGDDDNGSLSGSAYVFGIDQLDALPTDGGSFEFTLTPNQDALLNSVISLMNTGVDGTTINVLSYLITGKDAGLFDLPGFSAATLTAGDESANGVAYDLAFSGAPSGFYEAVLTLMTDSGNVQYGLSASVAVAVPQPTAAMLGVFALGATGLTRRRRRAKLA